MLQPESIRGYPGNLWLYVIWLVTDKNKLGKNV